MLRKFFNIFGLFVVGFVTIFGLAACQGKEEFKVEFMVQDENNAWTVFKEEKVVEGSVVVPEAPEKAYYTFADWFNEEGLTTKFENKDIKANVKAYAKYTPKQVKITIDGKDEGNKNLIDIVNSVYNPTPIEGLDFRGWYKDSLCEVEWDGKEDVSELFAKHVALITYDNGYEVLYTETVSRGTVLENPATRVEGESNLETLHIVKDYMSKYDIEYVDENGAPIDFSKPVEKTATIKVLWNTKGLSGFNKLPKSPEEHYYIRTPGNFFEQAAEAPVVSIRNKITVENKEGEEITTKTYTVDYLYFYSKCLPDSVKKIIIGDGIKAISHFNGAAASSVEEIELPSTLKILDNSFNNMPNLKGVTLPEGLEVLIDSFFINRVTQAYLDHGLGFVNPNFEITVPESVKNIAMMPNNLKFSKTEATAENGDFYKGEDGKIYLKDERGLILVSDPEAVTGTYDIAAAGLSLAKAGTIVVPDGVVGIQAGTYMSVFDYLVIPESFKFVNYNANIDDYKEFYDVYHIMTTDQDGKPALLQMSGNVLFDQAQYDQYIKPVMNDETFQNNCNVENEGLTLTTNVGGFVHPFGVFNCGNGIVSIQTTKENCPQGIETAFIKGSYNMTALPNLDKYVNYVDDVNNVYLTAAIVNPSNFFPNAVNLKFAVDTISYDAIKEELIKANSAMEGIFGNIKSYDILNNGVRVEDNTKVTSDMFLTVVIVEKPKLIVTTNYRVSQDDNWEITSDPSQYTGESSSGDGIGIITDLTGLTKEKVLEVAFNAAFNKALEWHMGEATDEQLKANLKWSFDNAVSVSITIDGTEVTDFGNISLENGDVTITILYEFAEYATPEQ